MSNWVRNGGYDLSPKIDICNKMLNLIPIEIRDGYELDELWITTFSLDMKQLAGMLEDLGAIFLIGKNKIHIFYDGRTMSATDEGEQIISDRYLHPIVLEKDNKLYAFHPKVLLLRYKKDSNIRYVIVVMSKNISSADLLDSFAIAYGDVGNADGDEPNGNGVVKFYEKLIDKSQSDRNEFSDILDELRKVNFVQGNNGTEKTVEFLQAADIMNRIKDKAGIIIVSPFLADGNIEKLGDGKITKIISSPQGFGSCKEKEIADLATKQKCCIYNSQHQELHAKIYCWKEGEKTCWIIGSSNFTQNGCSQKSNNIEYNMYFETGGEDYEEYLKLLNNGYYFKTINISDLAVYRDSSDDETKYNPNPRDIFSKFNNCVEINPKAAENDIQKKYICTLSLKKDKEDIWESIVKDIMIKLPKEDDYHPIFNGDKEYCYSSDRPFDSFTVRVTGVETNRDFRCSIYSLWSVDVRGELDKESQKSYLKYLEYMQEKIMGSSANKMGISSAPDERGQSKGRKTIDKKYIYEKLILLSRKIGGNEEAFKKELKEIRRISDVYIGIDKENKKHKYIIDIIDNMLGDR